MEIAPCLHKIQQVVAYNNSALTPNNIMTVQYISMDTCNTYLPLLRGRDGAVKNQNSNCYNTEIIVEQHAIRAPFTLGTQVRTNPGSYKHSNLVEN